MIIRTPLPDRVAPPATPASGPRRRRGRTWLLRILVVTGLLIGGAAVTPAVDRYGVVNGWWPAYPSAEPVIPAATSAQAVTAAPTVAATPNGESAPDPAKVLQLPGKVPSHGDGTMVFAAGHGAVLGRSGPLRRFRVAVERDSGEDVDEFAALVEATLGDPRSWIGSGLRLRRVPKGEPSEFTVHLATRDTAQRLCLAGGVDLRVGGVPYTSCRTTGHVIINLDRWWRSSTPYRAAKVPLAVYRSYVVNHEVGHQLGHHHEGCPRRGGPAPVMVQQTLTLRGCTPYPWPRRGGKRYSGQGIG